MEDGAGWAIVGRGSGWIRWVLQGVAVGAGDGVAVAPTRLAPVCRVGGRPRLVVEGAVETLRDTVLGENIGVEKDAGLVGSVYGRVTTVISCLYVA